MYGSRINKKICDLISCSYGTGIINNILITILLYRALSLPHHTTWFNSAYYQGFANNVLFFNQYIMYLHIIIENH